MRPSVQAEPVQLELQAQRLVRLPPLGAKAGPQERSAQAEQAHPLSLELAEPRAQQLAPEEALQGRW